jgi:hypothetical protein
MRLRNIGLAGPLVRRAYRAPSLGASVFGDGHNVLFTERGRPGAATGVVGAWRNRWGAPDRWRPTKGIPAAFLAAVAALCLVSGTAGAGSREQARRMHERLTGIPPEETVLNNMAGHIEGGDPESAAALAMANSAFYNVTLKNMVTPWTNRDQTVFAPLNDYTATVIGMVRDNVPFNTLLSANLLYVGSAGGVPAVSASSNAHYEALEDQGVDLRTALVATSQTAAYGLPQEAVAGVMTTRAAAEAFFVAGTNRAMFRFTLLNHLCRDLEQVMDTSRPPDRIRQDVSRSPGGDSRVFLNNCIGCHSGMDPMAQAYAYYTFDPVQGRLLYSAGQVHPKYFNNSETFRYGYVTPDDRWTNYWRSGPNALLGWSENLPGSGTGAASMGDELANSTAFARCQVEKVFRNVCLRPPVDSHDRAKVNDMTLDFRTKGYQLKQVFAASAAYCMGDED